MGNESQTNEQGRRLLTVAQAARESGASKDTIRRHIAKGALPARHIGPTKRIRIERAAFSRYMDE